MTGLALNWLSGHPDLQPAGLRNPIEATLGELFGGPALGPMWAPDPDNKPQQLAYTSEANELLYGGEPGGGKSDLLLGVALTQARQARIFRTEFAQLKGLIRRLRQIVRGRGRFNGQDFVWRDLTTGREVEFGAMKVPEDAEKFQGRGADTVEFDELTNFPRGCYYAGIAWCRTDAPNQRTRVVAATNPPIWSDEGLWVAKDWAPWLDPRFKDPAEPGELRWYVLDDQDHCIWYRADELSGLSKDGAGYFVEIDGEKRYLRSRTYIPASVDDNSYYKKTNYKGTLSALPAELRHALFRKDWFSAKSDNPFQVIPSAWVDLAMERWRNTPKPGGFMTAIGVDVARGGNDKTVLSKRWASWFAPIVRVAGSNTPNGQSVATLVAQHHEDQARINVDVIGVGSSAFDRIQENEQLAKLVHALNASESSTATDKLKKFGFYNRRAEWHWKLREALDPEGGATLCLPPDEDLKRDLTAARWSLVGAKIKIEPKDEIKKRLGRSPDDGDAVAYAWAGDSPKTKGRGGIL